MSPRKQVKPVERALLQLDHRAHELVEPYADAPAITVFDWLSKLGDQPELRTAAGLLIAGGIIGANDRLTRAGARMIIAHEAATMAKDQIKTQIDRTRPRSASSRRDKKLRKGRHTAKEKTSFPSGHTAGAVAAARAISREYPAAGAAALAAAGLIAATQIVRRAHYPTDVVAGVAIGLLSEAIANAAWDAARMDERSTANG